MKRISDIERIQKEILENKYLKCGEIIDYAYFKQLYDLYSTQMSEVEFARILEIESTKYYAMKINDKTTRAMKYSAGRIIYTIQQDRRYYEKEELWDYNIDIDLLLQYTLCNGDKRWIDIYKTILYDRGNLWIGKAECSSEFTSTHLDTISSSAKKIAEATIKKSGKQIDVRDITEKATQYIIQDCGQIERNLGIKNPKVDRIIKENIKHFIKDECRESSKSVSKPQSRQEVSEDKMER